MIFSPSAVMLYLSQSKKTRNTFCGGGGGGGAGGNGGGGAGGAPNFIVTLATMLFELYLLVKLPPVQQFVVGTPFTKPCGNGYLAEPLLVNVWLVVPK